MKLLSRFEIPEWQAIDT